MPTIPQEGVNALLLQKSPFTEAEIRIPVRRSHSSFDAVGDESALSKIHCRKSYEPTVPDALPKAGIGHRAAALSAYWHFELGLTEAQILETGNTHIQFRFSAGGLTALWHTLAELLQSWYKQIIQEVQAASVLHADETGWRINGQTHWLLGLSDAHTSVYVIERRRVPPALQEFLHRRFGERLLGGVRLRVADREARHLAKRLEKYRDELFIFLDHPEVPTTNYLSRFNPTSIPTKKEIPFSFRIGNRNRIINLSAGGDNRTLSRREINGSSKLEVMR